MDIRVNQIPSLTWTWLHMNEARVKDVDRFEKESSVRVEVPENVTEEISDTCDLNVRTGMGENIDEIVADNAAKVHTYTAGTDVSQPVRMTYDFSDEATVSAIQLKVKRDSSMTVVQDFRSEAESGSAFVQIRYDIEDNAHLTLIQIQHLGEEFRFFNDIGGEHAAKGKFTLIQLILGGHESYYGCYAGLHAKRAELDIKIAYLQQGDDVLDMNYDADHTGEKSSCEIMVSGVLRDTARKLFRGTIDFHRGCAGAKGTELEDVLLMDDTVRNQTIPVILCDEEDVEGSHGASIGRIDENVMFYLQSRGIPETEIYEMMARAKVDAIASQIPDEQTREMVAGLLG